MSAFDVSVVIPSTNEKSMPKFLCRITGKQSIERLAPLLQLILQDNKVILLEEDDESVPDFVWETTCKRKWLSAHKRAKVGNKMHNTHVLESKTALALLQLKMSCEALETYVAESATEVAMWTSLRWDTMGREMANQVVVAKDKGTMDKDWWVVKASKGNGGRDVWVVNPSNVTEVLEQLPEKQEYVIQKYVHNPLLYYGKKFHFRCYSALTARGVPLLYHMAFILCAGMDFDYDDTDERKHVTNLSINKKFDGHPGQVPCHLPSEFPNVHQKVKTIWRELTRAASPFLYHQQNENNFEFFGIDIIGNLEGECWLIEVNRLPGLESSPQNKQAEDEMYDEMMMQLLRIVLGPIMNPPVFPTVNSDVWAKQSMWDSLVDFHTNGVVEDESLFKSPSDTAWANLMNWRAFTKKNWKEVHVSKLNRAEKYER